jgi:hypothetical protein
MKYDTMEQYRKGTTSKGHTQFSVPLLPDEDGFFGRECPNEDCDTKYFKIGRTIPEGMKDAAEDFSQAELTCPYCGTVENMQRFFTQAQVDWIKSMMIRDVQKAFGDMLENAFRPLRKNRGGMISVSVEVKRGSLPSVRYYLEEKLKQEVRCDKCGFRYAIYGVSFHCPLCGRGSLTQHLARSGATVRILAEEADRVSGEHGSDVGDRMLGNALEDVISLFEGFLKHAYRYAIRKRESKENADKLIQKIKVNFQRLSGAEEFFRNDLGIEIFSAVSAHEREMLEASFSKRHVLTHNLGLVDEKYKDQARAWERTGAEIQLAASEVLQALAIVTRVVEGTIQRVLPA